MFPVASFGLIKTGFTGSIIPAQSPLAADDLQQVRWWALQVIQMNAAQATIFKSEPNLGNVFNSLQVQLAGLRGKRPNLALIPQ